MDNFTKYEVEVLARGACGGKYRYMSIPDTFEHTYAAFNLRFRGYLAVYCTDHFDKEGFELDSIDIKLTDKGHSVLNVQVALWIDDCVLKGLNYQAEPIPEEVNRFFASEDEID